MADYDSESDDNMNYHAGRTFKKYRSTRSLSRSRSRSRSSIKERKRRHSPSKSRSRSPGDSSTTYRVHIGEIDSSIGEKDVEEAFCKFGPLSEVWVATYAPYFAFAVFKSRDDAEEAVRYMNGKHLRHCKIRVSLALPRRRAGGDNRDRRRFQRYNNYSSYDSRNYANYGIGGGGGSSHYRRGSGYSAGGGYSRGYSGGGYRDASNRTRSRGRSPSYDRYSRSP